MYSCKKPNLGCMRSTEVKHSNNHVNLHESLVYNIESVKLLSRVRLFATPWAVAYQAPPFTEFSRQEYWRGCHFLLQEELPNPGIKPRSPTLQAYTLPSEPPGNPGKFITLYVPQNTQFISSSYIKSFCLALKYRLQFSSVAQSCGTLRDPMDRSKPGLPVHHQLPEFTQTHVH